MAADPKPLSWLSLCLAGLLELSAGSRFSPLMWSRVGCRRSTVGTTPASSSALSTATGRKEPRCSCEEASRWLSGPFLSTESPSLSMRSYSTSARTDDPHVGCLPLTISLIVVSSFILVQTPAWREANKTCELISKEKARSSNFCQLIKVNRKLWLDGGT